MRSALGAVFAVMCVAVACGPTATESDEPAVPMPTEHSGPRADLGRCFDPAASVRTPVNRWRAGGSAIVDLSGGVTVAEGLDRAVIARLLRRQGRAFRRCYDVHRRLDPTLAGTITLSFTIGADGGVSGVEADGVSAEVAACVADVVSRMHFPSPEGGGSVAVGYQVILRPPEEVGMPTIPSDLGVQTSGPLDKESIQAVIRDAQWSFRYCYESALAYDPTLAGTVTAEFTIESDGSVSGATASGLDQYVDECVAATAATLYFPRQPGDKVNVRYPFVFESVGDVMDQVAAHLGAVTFDIAVLRPHVEKAAHCFADHAAPGSYGVAGVAISMDGGAVSEVAVEADVADAAIRCVRDALSAVSIEGATGEVYCDVAYGWERVAADTPIVEVGSSVRYEGVVVGSGDDFTPEPLPPLATALVARRANADDSAGLFVVRVGPAATFGAVWRAALTAYGAGYSGLRVERAVGVETQLLYAARAPLFDVPDTSSDVLTVISMLVTDDAIHMGAAGVEPRYKVTDLEEPEATGLLQESLRILLGEAGSTPLAVVELAADPEMAFHEVGGVLQLLSGLEGADVYLALPDALTTRIELVESGDEVEARAPK